LFGALIGVHEMGDSQISIQEDKSALEAVADWYESCVLLHVGAVALAPVSHGFTAIVDVGITSGFAFLRRSRLRAFVNELTLLNLQPTESEVRSEEFLEAFLAAASKVIETKRQEKIRLFSLLFRNYWQTGSYTSETYDTYEEDLRIIDELGYREFVVLSILHKHEAGRPRVTGENPLQHARKFWKNFQGEVKEQAGLEANELEGYLQAISRTGLYQPITGAYLDYEGGLGHLTPRFEKLKSKLSYAPE
jgi:hypothetical protein